MYDVAVRPFEQGRSKTSCQTTPYCGSQLLDLCPAKCSKGPKDMRSTPGIRGTRHRSPGARCQGLITTKPLMACRRLLRPNTFSMLILILSNVGVGLETNKQA